MNIGTFYGKDIDDSLSKEELLSIITFFMDERKRLDKNCVDCKVHHGLYH